VPRVFICCKRACGAVLCASTIGFGQPKCCRFFNYKCSKVGGVHSVEPMLVQMLDLIDIEPAQLAAQFLGLDGGAHLPARLCHVTQFAQLLHVLRKRQHRYGIRFVVEFPQAQGDVGVTKKATGLGTDGMVGHPSYVVGVPIGLASVADLQVPVTELFLLRREAVPRFSAAEVFMRAHSIQLSFIPVSHRQVNETQLDDLQN